MRRACSGKESEVCWINPYRHYWDSRGCQIDWTSWAYINWHSQTYFSQVWLLPTLRKNKQNEKYWITWADSCISSQAFREAGLPEETRGSLGILARVGIANLFLIVRLGGTWHCEDDSWLAPSSRLSNNILACTCLHVSILYLWAQWCSPKPWTYNTLTVHYWPAYITYKLLLWIINILPYKYIISIIL